MTEEQRMQQQIDLLRERVKSIEGDMHEMRLVVSGGDLSGKPGVLQNMLRILNALFDEKEGLVPRLTAMERRELERKGWIDGAKFVWAAAGGIIVWLLTKFVFK